MIFRREHSSQSPIASEVLDAWTAVERTQQDLRADEWFITQPDHAHISGLLAAGFRAGLVEQLTADVVEGIRLHDEGWAPFDGSSWMPHHPPRRTDGSALAFFELPAQVFLCAWEGSIRRAEHVSPAAGMVVSGHFLRLAQMHLAGKNSDAEQRKAIEAFVHAEEQRQKRLAVHGHADAREQLVKVLQLTDLLSLYLCSGASERVRFSHDFGLGPLEGFYENGELVISPTPFAAPIPISLPVVRFAPEGVQTRTDRIVVR